MLALTGLFTAALVAATLVPAQSEAVLLALILAGELPVRLLVLVATAGNFLGSAINWGMGRFLAAHAGRGRFPVRGPAFERASAWYRRWGRWSLPGAWLPVIADPLTLAAGLLGEPWRLARRGP